MFSIDASGRWLAVELAGLGQVTDTQSPAKYVHLPP